ncbi:MAG: hypothetical protein Q9170_002043 [Blastenia crenularia]
METNNVLNTEKEKIIDLAELLRQLEDAYTNLDDIKEEIKNSTLDYHEEDLSLVMAHLSLLKMKDQLEHQTKSIREKMVPYLVQKMSGGSWLPVELTLIIQSYLIDEKPICKGSDAKGKWI